MSGPCRDPTPPPGSSCPQEADLRPVSADGSQLLMQNGQSGRRLRGEAEIKRDVWPPAGRQTERRYLSLPAYQTRRKVAGDPGDGGEAPASPAIR
ncbi:unnamed protein product [Merluccius merluccius]